MTKEAALQEFFSGFGMDAYPSTAVPDNVVLPYLSYDLVVDAWGGGPVNLTVDLWFYTDSEALPNAKVREISAAIDVGGKIVSCDGGGIWLKRGSPWAQSLTDDTNRSIKRRYLNLTAEYLTVN